MKEKTKNGPSKESLRTELSLPGNYILLKTKNRTRKFLTLPSCVNEQVVQVHTIGQEHEEYEAKSMDRFKVTHTHPVLTPDEKEKIQKDILIKMNNHIQSKLKSGHKSKTEIK